MGSYVTTSVGTRCPSCGLIYPTDETHDCAATTPGPTQQDIGTPAAQEADTRPRTPAGEGPDLVGTVLGERYRIVRRLSAGGMGVVYQARHTLLNSLLAVKILLYAHDEDARARFLREAQIASQIQHPNTVFISDFGLLPDGRPYLVMEFLQGPTLRDLLERGTIDPLRACQLAAQIARGLQSVHEKGIVHRDLKPENIFVLEQDGQKEFVKIVDFGLARAGKGAHPAITAASGIKSEEPREASLSELNLGDGAVPSVTMPGAVLGTPAYMSPEQVRGDEVDARADQYALGCILFEMLTGQFVYRGKSLVAMLSSHIIAPIPSLHERAPELKLPDGLDALVRRALAKRPEERFASMRELELAIEKQIEELLRQRGLIPSSEPPDASRPTGTPRSRLRGLLFFAPLAVALLLAGAYLGPRYLRRGGEAEPGSAGLPLAQVLELRRRALASLEQDLGTPDLSLRRRALAALGQTRELGLVEPLKRALQDPNAEVQAQAAEALGALGFGQPRPELFAAAEHSPEPLVRVAAAAALDQLDDDRGRTILRQFLHDKNQEAGLRAAYWICSPAEREAQELILGHLGRGKLREDVAVSLWYRLAQSGDSKATQQLLGRLRTGTQRGLQLTIATQLARLGEEQGRMFLREQVRRPGLEQLQAARALSELDESGYQDMFRELVRSVKGSLDVRIEAVAGLGVSGRVGDMLLIEPVLDQVTGPKAAATLRQAAAVALLQLSDRDPEIIAQRSFEWANTAVADERWFIREAAAAALGDLDAEQAVPMISKLLDDREARVRQRAARALGRRVEDEAISALCSSLKDEDAGVRMESLRSLERVGKTLISRGQKGILQRAAGCLKHILNSEPIDEQIVGRAILLRLGDDSQRQVLEKWESSSDAAIRKLLIEQLEGDKELLGRALSDAAPAVRFAAARLLAESADPRALPVLKIVLGQGGTDGVIAYGLLRKLGVDAPSPTDLESLLRSADSAQRLATVEAIGRMPTELALPLLRLAARDPERLVRRLVGEVAADLKPDTQGHSGEPVLRILAEDRDLSVRTRAQVLLARFLRTLSPQRTASAEAAKDEKKEVQAAEPAAPKSGASPDAGSPGPQADGGAAAGAGTSADTDAPTDESLAKARGGGPLDPGIESLGRQGVSALARHDVRQAQRLFDKAQTLCARKQRDPAICGPLGTDFSYQLARAYESSQQWAEAMAEYQKVARATGPRRAKTEQRSTALEAIVRLSPRLGRIVITKMINGKCQQTELWMPPGAQSIIIGGKPQQVRLAPRETATFEECTLSAKKRSH